MKINPPFQTTTYRIYAACTPRRLALVTDLHDCDPEPVLQALREAQPDVIMISGDLYEGPPRKKAFSFDNALYFLAQATELAPVFYAQGNHDITMPEQLRNALFTHRICLLENNAITFRGITVGGICSAYYTPGAEPDTKFLDRFCEMPGPRVLLCHHPEYYRRYLRHRDIDLILSGHNHGGQWEFFGRGVYVPRQGLFPPYTAGVYDGRLVVSRGVANNVRVPRINNPTELVIIEFGS